jgi:hypothetical protein
MVVFTKEEYPAAKHLKTGGGAVNLENVVGTKKQKRPQRRQKRRP